MERVVAHVAESAPLEPHLERCRSVIAPKYVHGTEVGPQTNRLEAACGGILARALLDVTRDEDLSYGEYGKPFIPGAPEFNLSNDGGIVVLAMGARPLGADVESIPSVYRDPEALICRKFFDEDERAAIGDGSTCEQRTSWARAWTRREAILKAMGTGFAVDPRKHPEVLEGWHLETRVLEGVVLTCAMDEPFELELVEFDAVAALRDLLG